MMFRVLATALVAASLAAPTPAQSLREEVNVAIDRGVEWLLETQLIDGSWYEHQPVYRAGQTALNLYALLECDLEIEHPSVQRARNFLFAVEPYRTYEVSVTILAFIELLKRTEDAEQRARLNERIGKYVELLIEYQEPGGGYAYPEPEIDLSNAQYAAMALHNAALVGFDVPQKTWRDLADYTLDMQDGRVMGSEPSAGFRYREDRTATGSMTAAGIATLHICIKHAARSNGKWERGLDAGMRWLAKNFIVHDNPQHAGAWHYYYLYNIERIGAYLGIDKIGELEWYESGAAWLVGEQQPKGDWWNQSHTAFALLFLKRATAPSTGGSERGVKVAFGSDDPLVPASLRAFGENPLRLWISSYGTTELEAFGTKLSDGSRGLDVIACEYWLDAGPGIAESVLISRVERKEGTDVRMVAEHEFAGRGVWTIHALISVRSPNPDEGVIEIVSAPLEIDVRRQDQSELVKLSEDLSANLLRGVETRIRVSSEIDGDHSGARLTDGIHSVGWVSAANDRDTFVSVAWNEYLRVSEIRLVHVQTANHGASVMPKRLKLTLNGKDEYEVVMPEDRSRTGRLTLDRAIKLRSVRIDVLETYAGPEGAVRPVGLGEMELHAPQKR